MAPDCPLEQHQAGHDGVTLLCCRQLVRTIWERVAGDTGIARKVRATRENKNEKT